MREPKPIPEGFEENMHLSLHALEKKYKAHWSTIKKWRAQLGYFPPKPSEKKAVLQYTKDGQFVKRYESLTDAVKAMYGVRGSISGCCHGKAHTAYGYVWRFADDSTQGSV